MTLPRRPLLCPSPLPARDAPPVPLWVAHSPGGLFATSYEAAMRPRRWRVGRVTTGTPSASPSALVREPPNGNGWSIASAHATSRRNSFAGMRGTQRTRRASSSSPMPGARRRTAACTRARTIFVHAGRRPSVKSTTAPGPAAPR